MMHRKSGNNFNQSQDIGTSVNLKRQEWKTWKILGTYSINDYKRRIIKANYHDKK